jgi:hypothetical protein
MATNFNDTTPAAPSNGVNVKWQTDGSGNNSAYLPATTQELVSANLDLTAQNANITTATLYTPSASGLYRISAYIIVTTVASTGAATSTLPSVTIGWTDKDNSTAQTLVLTPTNAGNLLTTYQQASCVIDALTAVAITYATGSYASNTASQMQYALHIRIEEF